MRCAALAIIPLVVLLIPANAQQCGITQGTDSFTVSCSGISATTSIESITLNGAPQSGGLPLVIPSSDLIAGDNTIVITFVRQDGSRLTSTLTLTTGQQRSIACRPSFTEDRQLVTVSCTINDVPFTGPARYSINSAAFQRRQSTPFNIRITEFREGENTVDLILEDNGEEISGLSLTVTIGTESTVSCSYSLRGDSVTITCMGDAIASYSYRINQGAAIAGSGAVEFTIGGDRLVVGNNTVTVTLFGADNSVLGSFPITFEIDAVFDPSCTLDNSAGGGITRVFCVVAGGSEQIQSYVYSGAVSGSGTAFPIEIDRRDITFEGENNVILILTSASGQRQTVRITLQRFQQSFSVRCRAAQTADLRNIELSCTETDSSGQTIDTIRYAINGVFALETVNGNEQPIVIPISDVVVGSTNNFTLVLTGSGGSELLSDLSLVVIDIPPQCTITRNGARIIVECVATLQPILAYEIFINGARYTISTEPIFPFEIDTNIEEFVAGSNQVVLVLYADRGRTVELSRETFTVTRTTQTYRVSCSGTFVDNGDLEITCVTVEGDQTISRIQYSLNNGQLEEVANPSAPFIIEASRLAADGNVVDITITGSRGSQLTLPSLDFSAPIECTHSFENGELVITCLSGGNQVQATYSIVVNNGDPIVGSEFPIRFRPNLLPNQRNEISLVLIGQDGETLLRQIFRFDTVNFEVECSGTFVEGGDLEIACTTPVGGQTISTLLYSLNGGPTVEVENPSLPFIIDASALSDSNVVDFTVIGSQGSQLTPSLEFSASIQCSPSFINDDLVIECLSGGVQVSATYEIRINNGGALPGSVFPIRIGSDLLSDGMNEISVILRGSDGRVLLRQVIRLRPIVCTYTVTADDITISCTGGLDAVDRFQYSINGGQRVNGRRADLPIVISRSNSQLSQTGRNTIVLFLFGSDGRQLAQTEFVIQVPSEEEINFGFPLDFSVQEGAEASGLRFGTTGTAVDRVPFSLVPLTYQQFQGRTGQLVEDVFSGVPIPPAASIGDISPAGRLDGEFGPAPVPLAADFIFNVNGAITDDATPEGDEGFILYFEFDEDDIDPADFSRLNVGVGAILITIWDDDTPLTITCNEILDTFVGGIGCTSFGGTGPVTYSCTTDLDISITPCPPSPLVLNFFDFEVGDHFVRVQVTDSVGFSRTFTYTFTSFSPPDLVLSAGPSYLIVGEDGTGGTVLVTKTGFSFGDVNFTLRPLTYDEYISIVSIGSLDRLFPLRPQAEASEGDFDRTVQGLSFGPGLLPQPPLVFSFSGLALPDSEPEFTEGLLLYLEIDESSLEPRDLERLQSGDIRIENGLILVSITGNDLPLTCSAVRNVLQELSVDCTGGVPSQVTSNTIQCTLNDEIIPCSEFPVEFDTSSASSGTYTVTVTGTTGTGVTVPLGEASFTVTEFDFYFINDTPVLVGGTVYAEFRATRQGVRIFCHLTHLDEDGTRHDCSNGTYRREGIPTGDFTLRVIAVDVTGEKRVIRNRLWVHSTNPDDQFCIMYLRNRGWSITGNTFSVDFTGTGAASGEDATFECSLDRGTPRPCSSPYVVEDLSPGRHHVRVRPTGCGKDLRVWNKRFTVRGE